MAKQRTTRPSAHPQTADDALAFRIAVQGVKPLPETPAVAGLAKPKPKPRPRLRKPELPEHDLDSAMPLIASPAAVGIEGAEALAFRRPGVRTQVVRRLRRGLIPIDGELDLHGLSQTAARDLLAGYLVQSRDAGWQCVRIIHGKGHRSGSRGPLLKAAVDTWLRRHADVMAFCSARGIDGGTGAVYVLLRS
jgi:DNA-nicking Smr family endonuclease